MNQELIGFVCVTLFSITFMFWLCLDVWSKSYIVHQLNEADALSKNKAQAEADSLNHEQKPAYPYYADYIQSTDKFADPEGTSAISVSQ
ncbi:hypothetical protein [Paenibacillus agricola]|uniref:Uncharacterized protein n=1 Tax=Paenibacillus agricola TaxID=2716264 RepID=A0ABX0J1D9_9BACL|nr:hypothetical protein [Paenibacillus agricola]NHN29768.1 hypothetical protein [Paenibacillus agricola]